MDYDDNDLWKKKKKILEDNPKKYKDTKSIEDNINTLFSNKIYFDTIEKNIEPFKYPEYTNESRPSLSGRTKPKKPTVVVVQRRPSICSECKEAIDTISEGLSSLYKKPLMEVKRLFEKAKKISSSSSCSGSKIHYRTASILSDHLIQAEILEWEGENHPDQLEKAFKICEEARRKAKTIGNKSISNQIEDIFLGKEAEILFECYLDWMNLWDSHYQTNPQEAKQYLETGLKALRGSIEKVGSFKYHKSEKPTRHFKAYESLSLAMKSLWHDKDKKTAVRQLENAITLLESSKQSNTAKFLKEQLNQMKSGNFSKPGISAITYVV